MYYNDQRALPAQVLVVALAVFAFVIYILSSISSDFDLAREGLRAPGVVTAIYPQNHSRVEYKFEFQGRTITGEESGSSEFVGDSVTVTFDPKNPAFSTLGDPYAEGRRSIVFLLMLLGVPAFIASLFVMDRWERSRKESRARLKDRQ